MNKIELLRTTLAVCITAATILPARSLTIDPPGLGDMDPFIRSSIASMTESPAPGNTWIRVPTWLAGVWVEYIDSNTSTYNKEKANPRSAVNRAPTDQDAGVRTITIGMDIDNFGRIWHYTGTPWYRCLRSNGTIRKQTVETFKLLHTGGNEVSMLTVADVELVDEASNKTRCRYKQQTLSTYLPVKEGTIRIHNTVYNYSPDGTLINRFEETGSAARVCEFRPVADDELHTKFLEYMRAHPTAIPWPFLPE